MQFTRQQLWIGSGILSAIVLIALVLIFSFKTAPAFAIKSSAFTDNGLIPAQYTCDGENMSPPLRFENIPENTRSIVLYVQDLDAGRGGFDHLVVYNIPPETPTLPEGQSPAGSKVGLNSAEKQEYQPLCPASGTHRYLFTAYAVSTSYTFRKPPTITQLKKVMRGQVLARATITGKYTKK